MSDKGKKKKIRADFRKNRETRTRKRDLTRRFQGQQLDEDETIQREQVSGKGALSRRRTVIGNEVDDPQAGLSIQLDIDTSQCLPGRVLSVHGLQSVVRADDGAVYRCATRRILKTLLTDQRHVVAVGDRVLLRPAPGNEGIIERIEPRRGVICRTSRGRQHVLVANVDLLLIVTSVAQPEMKLNLIDRMLITAEQSGIRPVICINKIDLANAAEVQPVVGVYGQMGYQVLQLSAREGIGVDRLRRLIAGNESVVAGQSGVGKTSLLNAVDPHLLLPVAEVSRDTQKGRHTTSAARLVPTSLDGFIVDTPGIRQFQLWDVIAEEVPGLMRDLRPYVSHCRFPDCTHTHEQECGVKQAVADTRLDLRRYESYCQIISEL